MGAGLGIPVQLRSCGRLCKQRRRSKPRYRCKPWWPSLRLVPSVRRHGCRQGLSHRPRLQPNLEDGPHLVRTFGPLSSYSGLGWALSRWIRKKKKNSMHWRHHVLGRGWCQGQPSGYTAPFFSFPISTSPFSYFPVSSPFPLCLLFIFCHLSQSQ